MDKALDNAPNGYVTFDDKGIILEVNETLCSMLHYTKAELQGYKFESLLNIAGRIFFQTHFFPLLKMQTKVDEIFLNLSSKNSSLVPVITSSQRNDLQGVAINTCVFLPVPNRRKYEDEILASKKQAQDALKENVLLIEARSELDKHTKELDEKILRLNQVNNETLQFNDIINHEMKECVRKILIFSKLARGKNEEEDYLAKIIFTANRLKAINSSLNLFIGLDADESKFQPVDLNNCLVQAKNEVIKEMKFHGLQITGKELPVIDGVFDDLKMLFYQLISNSVKFRKGDEVSIIIDVVTYKENSYKINNRKYDYQDVIKITMKDNGKGFDNKHKEYVFAMLKKLHHETTGSGIGLALCKKILANHHGEISINSEEKYGTVVSIILPIKQSNLINT